MYVSRLSFLSYYHFPRNSFTVPRAPPSDVTGTNTSSTSLRVNWGEVPFSDQLGIIRGYRVLLWRTNQSEQILQNVTVASRNVSFMELEKYTNYSIRVSAFTVKGEGNKSEPIEVITDEDGESLRSESGRIVSTKANGSV